MRGLRPRRQRRICPRLYLVQFERSVADDAAVTHIPNADPAPGDLVVKRWTRYGKDRLYVETVTGVKVGFLDLLTGQATIEQPEMAAAFHEVVNGHQAAQSRPSVSVTPAKPTADPSERSSAAPKPEYAVAVDWTDLSANRPGQGVRAEAGSLLADMKSTSKVGTFLKRALDVKTDERAFRVGADGEEAVGARLDRLTKYGWHVLHSIPVGERGSDIDHLVISKGGVYPVNTKRHPGGKVWVGEKAILVNGQRTDYLRNSRYEAERVRKALLAHLGEEVPVRAVLVFLTGTVVPQVTIKQMPEDVLVMDRMDIPGAFRRAPERMSPEMIERVYDVARRSTTWSAGKSR